MVTDNKIPDGYKLTEAGVIPEDWDSKRLGDLFCLKSGVAFSSEYFNDNGPILLTPGNFKLSGGLSFNEKNTKRYSGEYTASAKLNNGDLLIVMTDLTPGCNLLGKPAFVQSDEIILHNQRIGKVELRREDVDKNYMFHICLSKLYLSKIKETATGSTVRHTSSKSIHDVVISLPPFPEQQAIVQILSDMDTEINQLEQKRHKYTLLKQGMMQQLLTGKIRLT